MVANLFPPPIIDQSKEVGKSLSLARHVPRCAVLDKGTAPFWIIEVCENKSNPGVGHELLQILDRLVVFRFQELVELRDDVDSHARAGIVLLETQTLLEQDKTNSMSDEKRTSFLGDPSESGTKACRRCL